MNATRALPLAATASTFLMLVATPSAAQVRPYRAVDLGSPIGQSPSAGVGAEALSPSGDHVAGWSVWEPYVWDRGTGMRALQKPTGDQLAGALDVNDAGFAVGRSGGLLSGDRAVLWDPAGNVLSLHQTGWNSSVAVGINGNSEVLILANVPQGSVAPVRSFAGPVGGPYVDLAPTARAARAYAINDAGQVCIDVDGTPMRYTRGVGLQPVGPYQPECINEIGQMAGQDTSGVVHRYTDGLGWQPLGGGPGMTFRDVGAINSFGQVVMTEYVQTGISPPSYARYGHLYTDGLGIEDLNLLVDASQQVRVETVVGITDNGSIACEGSIGPDNRAMLLEPRYVSTRGTGCPGRSGTAPKAIAAGTPAAGGRIVLLAAGGRSTGSGTFLVAARPAAVPVLGCTLLVDAATSVAVPVGLNVAGQGHVALGVPQGTAAGALHVQFVSLDSTAPNGFFTLSNAVRIDLQ